MSEVLDNMKAAETDTFCDICGAKIATGETIFQVFDTNENSEEIALEHIYSHWILDSCSNCHSEVNSRTHHG